VELSSDDVVLDSLVVADSSSSSTSGISSLDLESLFEGREEATELYDELEVEFGTVTDSLQHLLATCSAGNILFCSEITVPFILVLQVLGIAT
jgi:hypothetical protein